MAVMIRLSRQGAKKKPQYIIVAMDSAKKRDGQYLENLGHYFPKAKTAEEKFKVNVAAIQAWQAKGATCTRTVGQLLKSIAKV